MEGQGSLDLERFDVDLEAEDDGSEEQEEQEGEEQEDESSGSEDEGEEDGEEDADGEESEEEDDDDDDDEEDEEEEEEDDPAALADFGKFSKYIDSFSKNGELSDAEFKELEKDHGIPRTLAESFVAGQKALSERAAGNAVMEVFGDADSYTEALTWGKENLTKAQQKVYNDLLAKGDGSSIELALSRLQRWHEKSGAVSKKADKKPERKRRKKPLTRGKTNLKGRDRGFTSDDEQVRAQADPRYGVDEDYTAEVDRKVELMR